MFRFSIRELFLTTTLAAACVAWWLDHERLTNAPEPPLMVRCGEDECMCVTDEEGKKLYIKSATLDVDQNGQVRHSYAGRHYSLFPHIYINSDTMFSMSSDGSFFQEGRYGHWANSAQIQLFEFPSGSCPGVWEAEPGMPVECGAAVQINQSTSSLRIGPPFPKKSE